MEQRFGRIHRIGQTEVCHLWNLVAEETREGDVYRTLLDKLEQARQALGGQVFDVLGKLQFEGRPLRDLLLDAIRYGERPEVRARLTQAITSAVDRPQLQALLEERALAHDAMDASRVARVREEMERAEARRLQPHYIESFFLEAFTQLGGTVRQREPRRYEVTHVPAPIRNRDRLIGIGEPVLPRYERIAFEKTLIAPQGQPLAAFVCPGHPLLDATLDLTLERHRDLLRLMWDAWNDVFRKTLGQSERSLVIELRDVRNRWAHQEPFSGDDTDRALDSVERLLTAVSAPQADEIRKVKMELRRTIFDEQARSERRRSAGTAIESAAGAVKTLA